MGSNGYPWPRGSERVKVCREEHPPTWPNRVIGVRCDGSHGSDVTVHTAQMNGCLMIHVRSPSQTSEQTRCRPGVAQTTLMARRRTQTNKVYGEHYPITYTWESCSAPRKATHGSLYYVRHNTRTTHAVEGLTDDVDIFIQV